MLRWLVSLLACAAALPALAADHRKLESGLPVRVEDAYPLELRALEVQPHVRYEMRPDDRHRFLVNGKVEWGAVRNGQLSLEVPFAIEVGDAVRVDAVEVEAFYNLNVETVALPALALAAAVDLPTSLVLRETDVSLKGILTKGLAGYRFHLNYAYTFFGAPDPAERANGWMLGLAADRLLTLDLVGVAAVWTERGRGAGEANLNAIEAGVRWMLTPSRLVALGAGVGFGGARDRPYVAATVGYQQSL